MSSRRNSKLYQLGSDNTEKNSPYPAPGSSYELHQSESNIHYEKSNISEFSTQTTTKEKATEKISYGKLSRKSILRPRGLLRRSKTRTSLMSIFDNMRDRRRYTEEEKAFLRKIHVHSSTRNSSFSESTAGVASCKDKFPFFIDPSGSACYYWLMMLAIVYVYSSNILILRAAFTELQTKYWKLWLVGDCIWDLINMADIILCMHIAYMDNGIIETDLRKIKFHYLHSFAFAADLLAMVPVDMIYIKSKWQPILRMNRLTKGHRVTSFFEKADSSSTYPNALRLLSLLSLMFTVIHWNACIYFLISRIVGFGTDDWVYPGINGMNVLNSTYASSTRKYIQSFYWSTFTLTTIGELTRPTTNVEYTFVIIDFLIGILLFATVVGYIGNVVQNTQMDRVQFQRRLDAIKIFMHHHQIPNYLRKRVIQWFDYSWENKKHNSKDEILKSLPNKLKAEITSHVYLDSLKRVALFKECETGFLYELVLRLRSQLYLPEDFIYCKGEVGYEMYIVHRGKVQVLHPNGTTIIEEHGSGYHFGEISLLDMNPRGNRRIDTVKSVGFTELFVISKRDFVDILSEYPEMRLKLVKVAQKKISRAGISNGCVSRPGTPNHDYRHCIATIGDGLQAFQTPLLSDVSDRYQRERQLGTDRVQSPHFLSLSFSGAPISPINEPPETVSDSYQESRAFTNKQSICCQSLMQRLNEIENRVFVDIKLCQIKQSDKMKQLEMALKLLVEKREYGDSDATSSTQSDEN